MACSAACSASTHLSPSGAGGRSSVVEEDEPTPAADGGKTTAEADLPPPVVTPRLPTPMARDECAGGAFHPEGCPCVVGETAECWTGPAAQRNMGTCRDGSQTCTGNADAEFGTWSPCLGEVRECGGTDECLCVPGSVAYCDEDCTVSIFCSLTATKTCQPDGTWGRCTEAPGGVNLGTLLDGSVPGLFGDAGVPNLFGDGGVVPTLLPEAFADAGIGAIVDNGVCRHWFHGCEAWLPKEIWVGDCSQQFTCKHAPQ